MCNYLLCEFHCFNVVHIYCVYCEKDRFLVEIIRHLITKRLQQYTFICDFSERKNYYYRTVEIPNVQIINFSSVN